MISFIVPAHNEEVSIVGCLAAIATAMGSIAPEHEVIVVDDASTDSTARLAAQQAARVIHVTHRHIAATRNSGAKEAEGEVLFFVDGDTLISPEIIHSALRSIEAGAAGGGCVPRYEEQMPRWFSFFYPLIVIGSHMLQQTGGACVFCTREAFAASGGFSEEHYAAEEVGWIKGIKRHGRFVILPEKVVTSGRSVRAQSPWTIARLMLRLALRGPDGFRDRRGLDLWYRPFRDKTPSA